MRHVSLTSCTPLCIVARMMESTDRSKSRNRRVGAKAAVLRAGELWKQHCSWCPRCNETRPGCELGRKAFDLYAWLVRVPTQRAG
jgi:hypothetical protein